MSVLIPSIPELAGASITPTEAGVHVRDTETHAIEVHRMLFNWRVVRIPHDSPWEIDRAWCYYGTGPVTSTKAILAALAWDGADDTAPAGWDKNARTGEYASKENDVRARS